MPKCTVCNRTFARRDDFEICREDKNGNLLGLCRNCASDKSIPLPPWVERARREEEEKESKVRHDLALKAGRKRIDVPVKPLGPSLEELYQLQKQTEPFSEHRSNERFAANFIIEIRDVRDNKVLRGAAENISKSGCLFTCVQGIRENNIVDVTVKLTDGDTLLHDTGKVVRANEKEGGYWEIGLTFTDDKEQEYVKERRRFKRFPCELEIEFWRHAADRHAIGKVVNFSKGGLCFHCPDQLLNVPMINFMVRPLAGSEGGIAPFGGIGKVVQARKLSGDSFSVHISFVSLKK